MAAKSVMAGSSRLRHRRRAPGRRHQRCGPRAVDRRWQRRGRSAGSALDSRRLRRRSRARSIRATDGSIGCRNTPGTTPMTMAIATTARSRPTRAAQIGQPAVLLVRHRAVVDALEHPQHVDRRQNHAGRRERRERADSSGTRRAGSGTRRRSRSCPGSAIDDSVTSRNAATRRGITAFSPPNSAISRVCRRSESMPTSRNSPPVVTPWLSIW